MSTDSQQARRLACDRCRGQKLKCERSNIPDCCQRCRKADAPCSFGQALPPGRPRTNDVSSLRNLPELSTSSKPAASPGGETHAPAHNGRRPSASALDEPDESSGSGTWSQPGSVDNDSSMVDLIYDGAFAAEFGPSFGTWPVPSAADKPGISWQDVHPPHSAGAHTPFNAMADLTSAGGMHQQGASSSSLYKLQPSPQPVLDPGHQQITPCRLNLHALMHKLTQVGISMHEIHSKYALKHYNGPDQRDTFPMELSGEVLQVATKFLELLRSSSWTSNNSSAPAISRRNSPPLNSSMRTEGVSRALTGPTLSGASKPPPPSFIDRPAALQLIASYQRLLDLYLLFYKAVYNWLCQSDSAGALLWQAQPIWKDLTLGVAVLHQFADLQVVFVLQAAARTLRGIESALGLPQGSRVSKNSTAAGEGILTNIVTDHFVEICMAEESAGPEQGQGAIARVREMINCLAVMLDDPGAW